MHRVMPHPNRAAGYGATSCTATLPDVAGSDADLTMPIGSGMSAVYTDDALSWQNKSLCHHHSQSLVGCFVAGMDADLIHGLCVCHVCSIYNWCLLVTGDMPTDK